MCAQATSIPWSGSSIQAPEPVQALAGYPGELAVTLYLRQWVVGASLVFSSFVLVMSSEGADGEALADAATTEAGSEGAGGVRLEEDVFSRQGDGAGPGQAGWGGPGGGESGYGGGFEDWGVDEMGAMAPACAAGRREEPELEAILGCSQL